MNTTEKSVKLCPTCSRPLPAGAPAGLCPACLLAQGAETESRVGGERHRFEPPTVAEVAKLFPQLEIRGLLGAGGMGAVYQARQPALDRMVALKILPQNGPGGASFEERFNREARALARLNHPNIVTVHEFGRAGSWHYFIMEFVDGANLRQLEQASRLSAREALQIIPQICDALQYAHDEGVVHRDIKPENVLVDRKGRVKIADFGLAKILGHDPDTTRLTVEGQVMGTPHYMAPEQVERPLAVDHRADIYSLGVVFYEMLTGDLPLGKFAPPSRKVQVDVRLDEIVLRALENDPARRYQQASEVKQRVATVVETPAPASPATAATEADEDAPKPGVRYLRWLGIPVVVERDGEREVNFQGTLTAVFVTMMVAALAHQIVRWVAGTEHALSRVVWLAGGLTVMWGIRRTLNQPWDDEPQRAANGTVVLAPRSRFPYWRDALMLVGLFAFTIGSHYFKTLVINRQTGRPTAATPVAATANSDTGTLSAALPGGGTMELLAISDPFATPHAWWRPDGRLITNAAFDVRGLRDVVAPNARKLDFAFRVTGQPPKPGSSVFEFEADTEATFGGDVIADGARVNGGWAVRGAYSPNDVSAALSFGYPVGNWRTVLTRLQDVGNTTRFLRSPGDPTWPNSVQVTNQGPDLRVTLELGPAPYLSNDGLGRNQAIVPGAHARDWRLRVVAVDLDGIEHQNSTITEAVPETSQWTGTLWTVIFADLPMARLKEVRVEVQKVQWVEFRNVALRPRGEAVPVTSATFGPPTLMSFDELVDFDTGHTADFPPAEPGSNPFAGIGENILWAQENGFDASAGIGELDLLGVTVAEISDAEWEAMTPTQAEARLATTGTKPRELTPKNPDRGTSPAYAFRTREGGVGLIRFVEFHNNSTRLTVQFKHVPPTGGGVRVLRAQRDGKTGELVGRLPGRGTVALVALRPAVSGPSGWRRADGQPATGLDCTVNYPRTLGAAEARRFELLFRLAGLPEPVGTPVFEFSQSVRHAAGGRAVLNGAEDGTLQPVQVVWPETNRTASVRVGVPMADWHPIRSYEPLSRSFSKTSWGDDPKWNIEMHAAGVGTQGAQITVVFGTNYPGWNVRVVATRLGQAPAVGTADVSATNGPAITRTYVFPELKTLDAVQNFQVQAQPLEWVEFADLNLALQNSGQGGDVSTASFRRYSVGRSWEEFGQARSLATPEQAVASFGLRLLGGEDHATVLAETTFGLPPVATNTLAYRPEAAQAERLRRQQVVSAVVYQERLAAVILAGESQGTPVFLTLVTGLQDGQWKVLPRFGSGLKTSLASAEAGFQQNAAGLLKRFDSLATKPETVPAGAAAETAADAVGSLLRSLLEATASQK